MWIKYILRKSWLISASASSNTLLENKNVNKSKSTRWWVASQFKSSMLQISVTHTPAEASRWQGLRAYCPNIYTVLPGSMVPIMVSYFNHSNFYGGSEPGPHQNLYANLHVYALILFITATVLNQITCLFAPVLLFSTLSFLISTVELWCSVWKEIPY